MTKCECVEILRRAWRKGSWGARIKRILGMKQTMMSNCFSDFYVFLGPRLLGIISYIGKQVLYRKGSLQRPGVSLGPMKINTVVSECRPI